MDSRTDGAQATRLEQRSLIASRTALAIGLSSLAALAVGIAAGLALVVWLR